MEQRLHVVISFPNDDPREADAFNSVFNYLRLVFPGEGFSLLKQVEGYWLPPASRKWVRDYSTWYITDIPVPEAPDAMAEIRQLLVDIRAYALDAYRIADRPQDEIWITSHMVERQGAQVRKHLRATAGVQNPARRDAPWQGGKNHLRLALQWQSATASSFSSAL